MRARRWYTPLLIVVAVLGRGEQSGAQTAPARPTSRDDGGAGADATSLSSYSASDPDWGRASAELPPAEDSAAGTPGDGESDPQEARDPGADAGPGDQVPAGNAGSERSKASASVSNWGNTPPDLPPAQEKDTGSETAGEGQPTGTGRKQPSTEDLASSGETHGTPKPVSVRLDGSLKNETAARLQDPSHLTKLRNQLLLSETAELGVQAKVRSTQRAFYDSVFDLTDRYSTEASSDLRSESELRDTYLDYSLGSWDIRLGKQQIVWGEAVGFFVADVVNAKDYREFILPDFDLIRLPDWAADIDYSVEDAHVEGVWIPFPRFNKLPVPGSEFAPRMQSNASVPVTSEAANEPPETISNSEVGGRLSYLTHGWHLTGLYLHSWDKSPVPFRSLEGDGIHLSPGFRRQDYLGGTFSKAVGDIVLKGEAVLNDRAYFAASDPADRDGVVRASFLDHVVGADVILLDEVACNGQFYQRIFFEHASVIQGRTQPVDSFLTVRFAPAQHEDRIEPELLLMTSTDRFDLLARPRITIRWSDSWRQTVGADLFSGNRTGTFGQFEDRSRFYAELGYSFEASGGR